ncbi:TIGR02391 family protein [Microbacterium testaceum]|uniref:TIGR02391 family protein n=1 Tax=Microbacterium testaceum TaxID=2033 RepID=UPI0025B0D6E7|nr:TIGR02391 family protein [Microbacterium testaceum]WJS89939.1 TIGR02391 family protein [Microbacterium testaceum]
MAESDALSDQERSVEFTLAEQPISWSEMVDSTASEAGLRLLEAFAKRPGRSWGAHQIVTTGHASIIAAGIARNRNDDVRSRLEQYVADGLGWLIARGLLGPAAEHSGEPRWLPTSDGLHAAELGSATHIEATFRLHADLHPSLDSAVRSNFEKGEYAIAAFAAARRVEIAVLEASGLAGDYGVNLVRNAFRPAPHLGPLTAEDDPKPEQEGVQALFAGMMGAIKNPSSHTVVEYDSPIEAANIIHFADLLLRMVDRARDRKTP